MSIPLETMVSGGLRMASDNGAGLTPDQSSALSRLSPAHRRLVMELALKLLALQDANREKYATDTAGAEDLDYASHVIPWIASLLTQGRSPGTIASYRHKVETLLQEYPQPTTLLIEKFLAVRHSTTVPHSIANYIFALRSFFSYLEERELLALNPVRRLKAPRQVKRERQIPQADHIQRLLSAPTTSLRPRTLILLLLDCGFRISEAVGLRVVDLHLDEGHITVIGKGNKQRSVPVSEETKELIQEYLLTLVPDSTWLFPGRSGTKHMSLNYADELLERLCREAGVPHITPHQLRHYFATAMLNDSANLLAVSQLLGHADISTTMIYWHADKERRREEHKTHSPLKHLLKGDQG